MRSAAIALILALAGCEDLPGEDNSIAYEGPSKVAPSTEIVANSVALDGRYGASAADCEPGNRYMTEFLEIEDRALIYRGEKRPIENISGGSLRLLGGERLGLSGDTIVRWPGKPRRRTAYTRCD